MTATIGLWIYRFEVYPLHGRTKVGMNDEALRRPPAAILQDLLAAHSAAVTDEDRQRIWYFEEPTLNENGETNGYVRYGTYGFESDFIDSKTKEQKYRRETHHYENISLYYQFWFPKDKHYGLMLLQSFAGRSCVGYVRDAFRNLFVGRNEGYSLRFRKIVPADILAAGFLDAPVTGVSFLKRAKNGDRFAAYGTAEQPEEIELEVTIRARKAGSFGPFGQLDQGQLINHAAAMFLTDDDRFDRASALVKIGKNTRKVNVFGHSGEAGSIDITDDVLFAESGHPDPDSLEEIANEIMLAVNKNLSGKD